ncbi:MAG: hypothetical protein AB9869_26990 [Verrucomicrobiia bacterium]
MNPTASIPSPRLPNVISALVWELAWKNRLIGPVLLLAFLVGAGLVFAVGRAEPDVWWSNYARGTGFITFTASILLAFAPFTLMESHGSWRMNSVITRWSVLPIRTCCLVAVPLAVAWVVLALVGWAWAPILERLFPGIDTVYMLSVYLTGAVAAQALAWAIPRKPSQVLDGRGAPLSDARPKLDCPAGKSRMAGRALPDARDVGWNLGWIRLARVLGSEAEPLWRLAGRSDAFKVLDRCSPRQVPGRRLPQSDGRLGLV